MYRSQALIFTFRSPNLEIRDKFRYQMTKILKSNLIHSFRQFRHFYLSGYILHNSVLTLVAPMAGSQAS
jgi:hypothetical protein